MRQEGEGFPIEEKAGGQNKLSQWNAGAVNYPVIAICVILSLIFMKTGLLAFFFLVPIGYAILVSGSVWITFFSAAGANIIVSVVMNMFSDGSRSLWLDILYLTIILLLFTWIMGGRNLRAAYRFVIASLAGAAVFLFFIMFNKNDNSFNLILNETAEVFALLFSNSANTAALDQGFTSEKIIELIESVSLRGGAVFSMFVVFFLNRQLTVSSVFLINKKRIGRTLNQYYVPSFTIWVLTGSLASVLLTSVFRIKILEIISWNILTVSAILFLAQGAGIVTHMLLKKSLAVRIAVSVLACFLIISPLSAAALALLLLLGIAETWLPMRKKRIES